MAKLNSLTLNGKKYDLFPAEVDTTLTKPGTAADAEAVGDALERGGSGGGGKSAYEYAQEGGFVGTEEDFAELLAGNSVKTFGAVGDGVADDTAAFQAALAAERVVRVYGGTYVLSDTLVIRPNCCLELSQDTVLDFTQTSGNCIEMHSSSTLRGNRGIIRVPYAFAGNVASSVTTGDEIRDTPPYTHWDPQWKRGRYIYDVSIVKPDTNGLCYMRTGGTCTGNGIYLSCDGNSEVRFMWGVMLQGVRIAGAFTNGIKVINYDLEGREDSAWSHDMRIEAVIEDCETGVSLTNCNGVHLAVAVQPHCAQDEKTPYAKWGVYLNDCRFVDMASSVIWDWNSAKTLYGTNNEYTAVAMYGNCCGLVFYDYCYHTNGTATRNRIYTDTPSNLEKMTILQEPITRWFKQVEGVPYFNDGLAEHRLISEEELKEYFDTDLVKNFTDVLSAATDASGAVISSTGYKEQYIHNSGDIIDSSYYVTTGFIPMAVGQTLYGKDISYSEYDGYCRINLYDASKALIRSVAAVDFLTGSKYYAAGETTDGSFSIKVNNVQGNAGTAFVRFSIYKRCLGENPMVSIDEEIKYTIEGFLADGVKVKGENVIGGAAGPQGPQGPAGEPGKDGYTPQRGTDYWTAADKLEIFKAVYPVGAVYVSTVSTSPATLFGFGTWERIQDRFLLSAGSTYAAGSTGGAATHTLTVDEMPSHNHSAYYAKSGATDSSWGYSYTSNGGQMSQGAVASSGISNRGGGKAHNNLPPYLAVYVWKRTA